MTMFPPTLDVPSNRQRKDHIAVVRTREEEQNFQSTTGFVARCLTCGFESWSYTRADAEAAADFHTGKPMHKREAGDTGPPPSKMVAVGDQGGGSGAKTSASGPPPQEPGTQPAEQPAEQSSSENPTGKEGTPTAKEKKRQHGMW